MLRIDAHHHLWSLARGDYHWLTPNMPIHQDYGLDDLRPLLGDIAATVLVQAAPTEAETSFMLAQARRSNGLVRAVVGWTNLAAANAAARIAAMAADPLLRGLRPMLQDIEETTWIFRKDVEAGLDAMTEAGLRLDLLVKPRHLPLIPELVRRHPRLSMVIDHGGKPAIERAAFKEWSRDIARAAEAGVFCKLSGLAGEAGPHWTTGQILPYAEHLLACFGADRLMWGSDWPVVDLAGGYEKWRDAAIELLPADAIDEVLGGAAARFYGLMDD